MKTAGVVFDFYDDTSGTLLKAAFSTPEELPTIIKEAHILNENERDVLRDEAYALVMSNNGHILRKFACVDAGNTLLSCLYFEENAQKLPAEAVKVAAANLASFCEDFGFEPTNFVKMAKASQSRTRDSMKQPIVGDEADWAARTNLVSIQGGGDAGRVIPTANQMKTASVKTANGDMLQYYKDNPEKLKEKRERDAKKKEKKEKTSGLLNVYVVRPGDMPAMPQKSEPHDKHKKKSAGALDGVMNFGRLLKENPNSGELDKAFAAYTKVTGKPAETMTMADQVRYLEKIRGKKKTAGGMVLTDDKKDNGPAKKNPDMLNKKVVADKNSFAVGTGQGDLEVNYRTTKISTVVDVSNLEPVPQFQKRASKRYALGTSYPLDSYQDVKAAAQYFDDYSGQFNSADRHEYAVKTAARAEELGIETSELLSRYGSTEYAPDIDAHLASRKAAAPAYGEVYDAMREKRAEVDPETFVELLQKVDEQAGLNWYYGGDVTDPYLATFGGKEKSASSEWSWESTDGKTSLTAEQLQGLTSSEEFKSSFDSSIVSEFSKDPTAIFDSMPNDTKSIMARMALAGES